MGASTVESSHSIMGEGRAIKVKSLNGSFVTIRANLKDSVISMKSKLSKIVMCAFHPLNWCFLESLSKRVGHFQITPPVAIPLCTCHLWIIVSESMMKISVSISL